MIVDLRLKVILGCILIMVATLFVSPDLRSETQNNIGKNNFVKFYYVIKRANIRAAPKNKSKKIGNIEFGQRVKSVGEKPGAKWISIERDGNKIGFVYHTALVRVVDGTLKKEIKGSLKSNGLPACKYRISFIRKNKILGAMQFTSDYNVSFFCNKSASRFRFLATMFITELPYRRKSVSVYQITIDLPSVVDENENVISITCLYNIEKGELYLVASNGSKEHFNKRSKSVQSLRDVLNAAVAFSYLNWNEKTWKKLFIN